MSNRLTALLRQWLEQRDETQWVLGTVVGTSGSTYRKTGAMMLFSGMGQQLGLLSGGCLESDIMRHAKQVMTSGQSKLITYDMNNDEDVSWQLGIGCGGEVSIFLQLVDAGNQYLGLDKLYACLTDNKFCWYLHKISMDKNLGQNWKIVDAGDSLSELTNIKLETNNHRFYPYQWKQNGISWLAIPVYPEPHLAIFGGGVDARPLVSIAHEIGWQVSLVDSRPANARQSYFPGATRISRDNACTVVNEAWWTSVNAAVVMTHNVGMDAEALSALSQSSIDYIGLLGPSHRSKRVMAFAGLTHEDFQIPIANPIGLNIGGDLPESIALSILAEAHAVLENRDAQFLTKRVMEFAQVSDVNTSSR